MYMPLHYTANTSSLAMKKSKQSDVNVFNSKFGVLFSSQDTAVTQEIMFQLKCKQPRIRLVFFF
jgi:hypothetical protein